MITYGGYPLLLEDDDGELRQFFENYLSLEDLHCFGGEPVARKSGRTATRHGNLYGVGLGLPNYPPDPAPRLNSLYWPTGASRWARGYFLCDDPTKKLIVQRAHTRSSLASSAASSIPLQLKMGDPKEIYLATNMYLLSPRPVAPVRTNKQLWLLPLVDARYWWQFLNAGDLAFEVPATWDNIYTTLASAITTAINVSTIPAAYLGPDPQELSRRYDNVAVLLDAVAHSVGHRIVRWLDGVVRSINAASSQFIFDGNSTADDWTLVAGDNFSLEAGALPASVSVAYPKYSWGVPWCSGDKYVYSNNVGGGTAGTTKLFHSSCYADFTIENDDTAVPSTPLNNANLAAMALQIEADYAAWVEPHFDMTFNGIKVWEPTGFDNFAEFTFGRQGSDGQYQAKTRVQSMPHDFGVESLVQQDQDLWCLDHFQYVVLDEDLDADGFADAKIWDKDGEVSPARMIRVYDAMGQAVATGTKGFAYWHCDDNRWYFLTAASGGTIVQVYESGGSQGMGIDSNGSCVWPGRIVTVQTDATDYCAGTEYDIGDDVWIIVINNPGGSGENATRLIDGDRYIAVKVGEFTVSADTRPLYAIRATTQTGFCHFTLGTTLAITDASAADCVVVRCWGGAPVEVADLITVYNVPDPDGDYIFAADTGKIGFASWDAEHQKWWIVWLKCASE